MVAVLVVVNAVPRTLLVHQGVAHAPLPHLGLRHADKVPKELRGELRAVRDVYAPPHQVVAHALCHHRVLFVLRVLQHLLPEPRCRCEQGPRRALAHKLQVRFDPVAGGALAANLVEVPSDAVVEPKERHPPVAIDDLVEAQLSHVRHGLCLRLALADGADVAPDPELLPQSSPPPVRPAHIVVDARHWHVEIEALGGYGAGEEEAVYGECGVFKVCEVDLHGAELDAPVDGVLVDGRGLEAHSVPVCALYVLKVVILPRVVLLELGVKDHEGVPDEEVRNVVGEARVEPRLLQARPRPLVDGAGDVVELVAHQAALADEAVNGRVPALVDPPLPLPQSLQPPLAPRPVVDAARDDVPTDVGVGQHAPPDGGRRGEGEEERREDCQLVVEEPRLAQVLGLKRHLEAPRAHAECHAIQVDRVWGEVLERFPPPRLSLHLLPLPLQRPVRVFVLEDRDGHHDLLPPPLADVCRKGGKAGVRLDALIGYVQGARNLPVWGGPQGRGRESGGSDARVDGEGEDRLAGLQELLDALAAHDHVGLHLEEVGGRVAVGLPGGPLEHPVGVLRVPDDVLGAVAAREAGLEFGEGFQDLGGSERQRRSPSLRVELDDEVLHLVPPAEEGALYILEVVVDVDELLHAVLPHVIGVLLGLLPLERRPGHVEEPHPRAWCAAPLPGSRASPSQSDAREKQQNEGRRVCDVFRYRDPGPSPLRRHKTA
mmetsp:Transcript_38206/g.97674  ORF Transcript_38206/g.97674 Transcript_38206/m.97674 type:complete len:715 (+) Transcript_38206:138-2282(+)